MSVPNSIGKAINTVLIVSVVNCVAFAQNVQVPDSPVSSESGVVVEAAVVLQDLTTGSAERIPERLLAESHAIAIVPHYIRGAFVVGISGGRGVVVTRDATGNWMAPEFITLGGGSFGWQIGVQATDLVLVFRTPRSLTNLRQGKITLGADASVAAGPVGRYASAATDTNLQAEILTYSRSRGLFAGISLTGASLQPDVRATQNYYQTTQGTTGVVPASAQALVKELVRFTTLPSQHPNAPSQTSASPMQSSSSQLSPGTTAVEQRVAQISQAVSSLQAKVDAQWKQYLQLPPTWFTGKLISSEEVHQVLIRYERIETNPKFSALRSQPEFPVILTALRDLASRLPPTSAPLALPSPPVSTPNRDVLP